MRLSVLALFIALPAAVYAAGSPPGGSDASTGGAQTQKSSVDTNNGKTSDQKASTDPKADCTPKYNPCDDVTPCCDDFICQVTGPDSAGKPVKVCFIVHLL
jgi:hypothetical protein